MEQHDVFEIGILRITYYYLLVLGILSFFSGFMRLVGFFMGTLVGLNLALHALYALAVSFYCFYSSQQLRKFTKSGYYLALGFAFFMALASGLGCFATFRVDVISALLMALLSALSVFIAWSLMKASVRELFFPPKPGN
ncbi:MAG: hypothetical protein FJ128_09450 [Deltaproteobacteria bacterium]|nr:hypothetical protein [Deltaproteobacteria bacterium]